eukprot:TRINITY_DN3599_c0_g2_i1.p1 TRINITY_DN3599_c0_g2~~TRINITY_DN3599_c0_g2_i1.p1  ORF type:complete len:150 (-),score=57.80 TRINITY_DN3599_c0_g2_i1:17-466(-)
MQSTSNDNKEGQNRTKRIKEEEKNNEISKLLDELKLAKEEGNPNLADLFDHCETICYPMHCGLEAFDFSTNSVNEYLKQFQKKDLVHLLKEISENRDPKQLDWDLEDYLKDSWDHIQTMLNRLEKMIKCFIEGKSYEDEVKEEGEKTHT